MANLAERASVAFELGDGHLGRIARCGSQIAVEQVGKIGALPSLDPWTGQRPRKTKVTLASEISGEVLDLVVNLRLASGNHLRSIFIVITKSAEPNPWFAGGWIDLPWFQSSASGGGGIRTHGTGNRPTGFRDRPFRPLRHPSESLFRLSTLSEKTLQDRDAQILGEVGSHMNLMIQPRVFEQSVQTTGGS